MQFKPHVTLDPWQERARDAWTASRHAQRGPYHGIADVYTGAGKTFLGMACMVAASRVKPGLKVAVVCPTQALARQWQEEVILHTDVPAERVGRVDTHANATFATHDVIVYVLSSARRLKDGASRLARDARGHAVLLVVDECHRSGAAGATRIYEAATWGRLGLSATTERSGADAVDEDGLPVPLEDQPHGRQLGPMCFQFTLADGIAAGMLPRFEVHHHAVQLTEDEEVAYQRHEAEVRDCKDRLEHAGGDPERYQSYLGRGRARATPAQTNAAAALQAAYFARKGFLFQTTERLRVARLLVEEAWASAEPPRGAMLFHERVGVAEPPGPAALAPDAPDDLDTPEEDAEDDESPARTQRSRGARPAPSGIGATTLWHQLRADAADGRLPFGPDRIALEHAQLPPRARDAALTAFKRGEAQILVTVKALQEGIDIPDVGMGISVASTASARQRIQTMGRILRLPRVNGVRLRPEDVPVKQLHLVYVDVEPDTRIYKEKDWGQETGATRNHWWTWGLRAGAREEGEALAPTQVPEAEAWERVKDKLPGVWEGPPRGGRYRWRHDRVSLVVSDAVVADPGPVQAILAGRKGQFLVTPGLHVVLTWDATKHAFLARGRLAGPLALVEGSGGEDAAALVEHDTADERTGADPRPAPEGSEPTRPGQPRPAERPRAAPGEQTSRGARAPARAWTIVLAEACAAFRSADPTVLASALDELRRAGSTPEAKAATELVTLLQAGPPRAGPLPKADADAIYRTVQVPEMLALAARGWSARDDALVRAVAGALRRRADGKEGAKKRSFEAMAAVVEALASHA